VYIQKTNAVLSRVGSLNPAARGTSLALKLMKKLPEVVNSVLSPEETDRFTSEVHW